MSDFFETARIIAFEQLKLTNAVSILDANERKNLKLQDYKDIWCINTEMFLTNGIARTIQLLIALPDDFPLVLPKIFLSSQDNEWIKYIPHVNVAGHVCLLDEETITLDTNQPGNILKECLLKAQEIIEKGLHLKNTQDFTDEFIAYWDESYDSKDRVVTGLNMIGSEISKEDTSIRFLYLKKSFAGHSIILHNDNIDFQQFKSFLKKYEHGFEEHEAFYIGEIKGLVPPFNYLNSSTYQIVVEHFPVLLRKYERFVNTLAYPKLVLFSIVVNGNSLFFGWQIPPLNTQRNGFRESRLSPMEVYAKFQKSDHVIRVKFDIFTKERIYQRTDGIDYIHEPKRITIAGLGSIGSNLLQYLLPLEIDEINLIDPDVLSLENINRHLLGLQYIRTDKVEAIKQFLELKNPLLKIQPYKTSVIRMIRDRVDIFNDTDYIFIAIGKNNIEEYIFDALGNNVLTKPIFFLWIEPYLCGAHCLFINPGHNLKFEHLFNEGLFTYNIIDSSEYKDGSRQLLFREAGCQSSYLPYGQKNITLFLSRLVPFIYDIMDVKSTKNIRLTWKGNPLIQDKLNLKLSDIGHQINNGEIQMSTL